MKISQRTIDAVKEQVRLVDLIGESVSLKLRGSNYVGLCPFHSEKTPSFHVRDNSYHCFGCGVSGNSISFVMESQGLSFPDAIIYLANHYGIPIEYEQTQDNKSEDNSYEKRKTLYACNELAFRFFQEALKKAPQNVIDYVKERGIDKELFKTFGIGFAPLEWHALCDFLHAHKFSDEIILECGLARRNQKGELYDAYRGRLIFPIFIEKRLIAGFGGRIIPSLIDKETLDNSPKYINSPESPIYQKNKILYALSQALPAAKEDHSLYIVEGYMDVISLWKAGVRNAVAPCGTALTENQVQRISKAVPRVWVVFDGDQAGKKAAGRAFELFINSGLGTKALFLPEEDDPDTVARRYGSSGIGAYLDKLKANAVPLIDCFINSLLHKYGIQNISEIDGTLKARLADEIAQKLKDIKSSIELNETIKRVSYRLLIPENDLLEIVKKYSNHKFAAPQTATSNSVSDELQSESSTEENHKSLSEISIQELPLIDQQLLYIIMAKKEKYVSEVLNNSEICPFISPYTYGFIDSLNEILLKDDSDEGKKKAFRELLATYHPSWKTHWKKSYQMLEDNSVDMEKSFQECLATIERMKLTALRQNMQAQLANQDLSEQEKAEILEDMLNISKRLAQIK